MRTLLARISRLAALAALVAAVGGERALADTPCTADAAKLCPDIPASDGRLWACLVRNEFQLSSQCVENIRAVQRLASEFNADCARDVYQLCASVPRGRGRVLECLRVHVGRRELSSNCEGAVITALEKLNEFADACANDAVALCPDVPAGDGMLFLCLRTKAERLSSRCRAVVKP